MASAPDSSPGGCPFKSGRVHFLHSPLLLQTLRLTQRFLHATQFSVLLFYFTFNGSPTGQHDRIGLKDSYTAFIKYSTLHKYSPTILSENSVYKLDIHFRSLSSSPVLVSSLLLRSPYQRPFNLWQFEETHLVHGLLCLIVEYLGDDTAIIKDLSATLTIIPSCKSWCYRTRTMYNLGTTSANQVSVT